MSAPYIIPFNFQPSATGNVANAGYTVPAGKYARVMANLSVKSHPSSYSAVGSGSPPVYAASGEDSTSIELFLKSGDVVSVSNSAGSATATASGNAYAASNFAVAVSTANISVNGTIVASVTCSSSCFLSPANITTMNLSGTSTVNYSYAEFNNIS
jgi:hypothetical protein